MPVPVPVPVPDTRRVPFDHERLHVYQAALDFVVVADATIEHFPRGKSHLADQLQRAATSIVLNIAEAEAKQKLERIASMLIKLAKSLEER